MVKKESQKNPQVTFKMFQVFNSVSSNGFHSKNNLFDLISLLNKYPNDFYHAFEQAHLKIFQFLHDVRSKKSARFEQLDKAFFTLLLQQGEPSTPTKNLIDQFLRLLCEAIHSSRQQIRVIASRMMFLVIEAIPLQSRILSLSLLQQVSKAIQFLLRIRAFYSRQLGVKLASMLFSFHEDPNIIREMFKILATESNEQIRKMVAINITLTPTTIDNILIRLRDKSTEIRAIVLRKLSTQHYPLEKLTQTHIYKILYDGFGCKDAVVREEAYKYFLTAFETHSDFYGFVRLFQPQLLLVHPDVRHVLDTLLQEILNDVPEASGEIKRLCHAIKTKQPILYDQMVWLKNAAILDMEVFNQECPTATELAQIFIEIMYKNHIFGAYETLLLLPILKMTDEIGRNNMFNALAKTLVDLEYKHLEFDYSRVDENDDICEIRTASQIEQKKLLLSYNEPPIITNTMDLIPVIAGVMQTLRPQYFEIEIKQIMGEWKNPQNTLQRQKQMVQGNIHKAQKANNFSLVQSLLKRYAQIEQQMQRDDLKTRGVILSLCRSNLSSSLQEYLPFIKHQLTKEDNSYALLMLGYYCHQSLTHTIQYYPLLWKHLHQQNTLLISLKVITDLINKFNLFNIDLQLDDYTHDQCLKTILQMAYSLIPAVKNQAVESICMMLYHDRIEESNVSMCFVQLLLLWWESEQTTTHTVNVISLFIKHYIERGKHHLFKLAEMLATFFKMFSRFAQDGFAINKDKLKYKLKNHEFMKKGISVALTVLKYTKESKQVIWTYLQGQLGPQEYFLVEIIHQPGFEGIVDRALVAVDFYENAPTEILLYVKKELAKFDETNRLPKKSTNTIHKYISHIETSIAMHKQEPLNQQALLSIQKQFLERNKFVEGEIKRLMKNIKEQQLFVLNDESQIQSQEEQASNNSKDNILNKSSMNEEEEENEEEKRKPTPMEVQSIHRDYRKKH